MKNKFFFAFIASMISFFSYAEIEPTKFDIDISIRNKGWFLASVDLSYYRAENGGGYVYQNAYNFPILQTKKFHVPEGSAAVNLKVYHINPITLRNCQTTIFFEQITDYGLTETQNTISYDIWGTIYNPHWRLVK